jgi:cytochrome P450
VLLDPETYSSERGGSRRHGGTLLQDLEIAGVVLSMMDDPRHARIRRLVSAGLTPRMVGRVEDDLRRRVRDLLAPIEDDVPVDIVTDVVAELAMQTIGNLVGVPEKDRRLLLLLLALRCRLGHHAQRHRRRPARARRAPRPARRPTRRPFPAAAGARGDPP